MTINHYITKSLEDLEVKCENGMQTPSDQNSRSDKDCIEWIKKKCTQKVSA